MHTFWYVLALLAIGLLAGALARVIVRSPRRLGCLGTSLLGIVGSYAGGSLAAILFHDTFDLRKSDNFIGAVVGSIVVLLLWRLFERRSRR